MVNDEILKLYIRIHKPGKKEEDNIEEKKKRKMPRNGDSHFSSP